MTGIPQEIERKRILVTVKAYPAVGKRHGEAVCVAGIDLDEHRWIRLYPIHFRQLPFWQHFKKYETIVVQAKRARDPRPESYTPIENTLRRIRQALPPGQARERRGILEPLLQPSMCEIRRLQRQDGTSLGIFRPGELLDFTIEREPAAWRPDQEMRLDQMNMFFPEAKRLEKVPYRFRFKYQCEGEPGCKAHEQSIIDWELGEAFRKWRASASGEDQALEMIRDKWGREMWGPRRDTFFFVGNRHDKHGTFLVLGVFWPQKLSSGGGAGPPSLEPSLGLFQR